MSRSEVGRRSRRRGISLIEMAVAALLVGCLMTAALQAAGQILLARRLVVDRAAGATLADSLLNEIRALPYAEPGTIDPAIGLDSGETSGTRSSYDDVDDYHNLSESPPRAVDGSPLLNHAGWSRSVVVAWVGTTDFTSAGSQSGAKRITVTVRYNGGVVATASGLRTDEVAGD